MKKSDLIISLSILINHKESGILEFLTNNYKSLENISKTVLNSLESFDMENDKFENHISLEETLNLAKEFLNEIDQSYSKLLDEDIKNGNLNLFDSKDSKSIEEYSLRAHHSQRINDGKETIHINVPLYHNIDDVYTLIHEVMHDVNKQKYDSLDGILFSEFLSIYTEFKLYEFLSNKGYPHNDIIIPINNRLDDLKYKSKYILYIIEVYKELINNPNIINEKLLDNKQTEEEFNIIRANLKYFLATLMSIFTCYKKIPIQNIKDFNSSLHKNNDLESLNYLFVTFPYNEDISQSIDYFIQENTIKK